MNKEINEVLDLICGDVRYELKFGKGSLGFSAPCAETDEELGELLITVGNGLKSTNKKHVVGECFICNSFIVEGEQHVCPD